MLPPHSQNHLLCPVSSCSGLQCLMAGPQCLAQLCRATALMLYTIEQLRTRVRKMDVSTRSMLTASPYASPSRVEVLNAMTTMSSYEREHHTMVSHEHEHHTNRNPLPRHTYCAPMIVNAIKM